MFEVEYTKPGAHLAVEKVDANTIRDSADGKGVDLYKFSDFVRRLPASKVHDIKVIADEK